MSPATIRGAEARQANLPEDLSPTGATSSLAGDFQLSMPAPLPATRDESSGRALPPTTPTKTPSNSAARPTYPEIAGLKILGVIGEGGMGIVYEAVDELNRRLAVKMVRKEQSASALLRFRDEADAMARLDHPHIAGILTFGTVGNRPYIVMKYYTGGTLHSRKAEYEGDLPKMAALMAKVADALAYLHANGHVHRDVKPQNILLNEKGEPFLSDFGLVKRIGKGSGDTSLNASPAESPVVAQLQGDTGQDSGRSHRDTTVTGTMLGTMTYMGPEQAKGLVSEAGPGWDIWSMGVMLYELSARRRPFEAREPDVERMSMLIDRMRPPSDFRKDLPSGLEKIILDCLRKNPTERLGDAKDLAERLRALYGPPIKKAPRWPWAAVAVAALLGLLLWAPWRLSPEEKLQREQNKALRSIEGGESLAFLTKAGEERLPLVAQPANAGLVRKVNGGEWCIDSPEGCFIDLLPRLPRKPIRMEIEFSFSKPVREGFTVGLYTGRRAAKENGVPVQTARAFTFRSLRDAAWNDAKPVPFTVFDGELTATFDPAAKGESLQSNYSPEWFRHVMSLPDLAAETVHTLRLDVLPAGTEFLLDGKHIQTDSRPAGEGALGIVLFDGGVRFRRIDALPLDPPE